jgi:hypothetical protein
MDTCGCSQGSTYNSTQLPTISGGGRKQKSKKTTQESKPKRSSEKKNIDGVMRYYYTIPGKGNKQFIKCLKDGRYVFEPINSKSKKR